MRKITKAIIIVLGLVLTIVFISFDISGIIFTNSSSEYEYTNSWTKAICNETHCQDYVIYCNEEEFVKQIPITGAAISIPSDWEDPRNETMRERTCELYLD